MNNHNPTSNPRKRKASGSRGCPGPSTGMAMAIASASACATLVNTGRAAATSPSSRQMHKRYIDDALARLAALPRNDSARYPLELGIARALQEEPSLAADSFWGASIENTLNRSRIGEVSHTLQRETSTNFLLF